MAKVQKRFISLAALVAVFFLSAASGWGAIDPSTVQKLVAGDGAGLDRFGSSVSVSGNTAIIGAKGDDDNGSYSGSAYVFVRDSLGSWSQQAKLLASDGADYDAFGCSVSISGDIAVVGAKADGDNGSSSGSAYVFIRDSFGAWNQQAKLLASDGATSDLFGWSVAVSGETAVIGAINNDSNGNGVPSGAAYVFNRDSSNNWNQQIKLFSEDSSDFGYSVSISGDTITIGSPHDNSLISYGSAYVFIRDSFGTWSQQAKLLASDGADYDYFGYSVSISGDIAVIGAMYDDDNGSSSGSAYVFVRDSFGAWNQQAKLLPIDGSASVNFGYSVSIDGNKALIGNLADSAYVFNGNNDGSWNQSLKLISNDGTSFGSAEVAVSGNTAIVGAGEAAFVYSSTPTTSNVTVTVTAPTSGTTYNHGNQVTINWQTENADPADTMVLSMKRDAASSMTAPDDDNWYRFTENTPNDGTETVTIPDSVLAASDWRFYVRHVASGEYAASGTVEIAEAENVGQLYIEKSGDGLGTVAGAPQKGIIQYLTLCDVSCTSYLHRLSAGEAFVLIAEADTNSFFSGWKGCDLVSDNACLITVNDYEEVSAQFNAAEDATIPLTVIFSPWPYEQGSIVSDPPGISCSDNQGVCRAKFVPGQTVTLTPTAAQGASFEGWTGSHDSTLCDNQSGDACVVTIPAEGYLRFHPDFAFDPQQNILNLTIDGSGKGSVTAESSSGSITCNSKEDSATGKCSMAFPEGAQITVTAVPESGSGFSRWEGWYASECFNSKELTCGEFPMTMPHTLTAVFEKAEADLVVDVRSNVDVLEDYVSVWYYIDVINKGNVDSGEAVVEIQASGVGDSGEEVSRWCDDQYNAGKGTCTKVGDNLFNVTVNRNEQVKIIVSRRYGTDVNTATLGANAIYPADVDIKDNEDTVELHRDPASLGLRTDVRLQYLGRKPSNPSERNTLVFTHGWQDSDPKGCEGKQGQDMLECFSQQLWSGMNRQKGQAGGLAESNFSSTAPNALESQVNILQYIWAGAFTQTGMTAAGYIQGRRHVFDAGKRLGEMLIEDLGSSYSGKIHFVGHSLGTAVNAYAVRYFLKHNTAAKVQMTVLDHPNRVSKIGILLTDMSNDEAKQWGFDENFFAGVLPELDDLNEKNRLYIDNYFAEKVTKSDTKINSAGVGTAISGRNVYNHWTEQGNGLHDPNDVGQHLFWSEGKFIPVPVSIDPPVVVPTWHFNDHSGVHQWYRWTMWPDRTDYLRENQFVCSNGIWDDEADGTPHHPSLNPCNTGFSHSILLEGWQPEDFPERKGYETKPSPAAQYDMVGGGTTQRCSMTESPLKITCSNLSAPMQPELALAADLSEPAAAAIDTASDYVHTNINLSKEIGSLSFKYRLTNTDTKEPVHLLIDGVVVWSMSGQSDTQEEWTVSGKIPVALTKGEHSLMLAFNRTSEDAEFAMQELQFFEAPSKNGFLPAMLFLLLNK